MRVCGLSTGKLRDEIFNLSCQGGRSLMVSEVGGETGPQCM